MEEPGIGEENPQEFPDKELEKTPPRQDAESLSISKSVSIAAFSSSVWQGPVPPPELADQYNQISPGLGTKLVEDGIEECLHRRKMEVDVLQAQKQELQQEFDLRKNGQNKALIISALGFLTAGTIGVCIGGTAGAVAASTITGLNLTAIVLAMIRGASHAVQSESENQTP